MMPPAHLLAKSVRAGTAPVTLQAHLLDTEQAAQALFEGDSRWARSFHRFFRLDSEAAVLFRLHVRLASLFHDVGKANADFLAAVGSNKPILQTLRHEHLSALILHLPQVRQWLAANLSLDLDVLTAAVLSHHFKAADGPGEWRWCQHRGAPRLEHHLDHPEVRAVLRRIAEVAGLGEPPQLPREPWAPGAPWAPAYQRGIQAARAFRPALRANPSRRALLLAVKAGLIAADAAASGLIREGHSISQWLGEVTGMADLTPADIAAGVLEPRVASLRARTGAFSLHAFQERAAELGPRALLLAACGAGKTLAAWKWAEAQARERNIGRVIFLYPTRGTATEGFRDYVGWAPEAEAALVQGTARYELEAMRNNPAESTAGKRYTDEGAERLFALGLWPKRYFSATVDQFLSFMDHGYSSTCLLPVLADSALVIDEVHSFDKRMFKTLVGFLSAFDVPVLCMTATLPASRRRELEQQGLRVYPSARERAELTDLEWKEAHPRYHLESVEGEEQALAIARAAFLEGRRVLWVVNQVARCQGLALRLRELLGDGVLCYHSRFCLKDRQDVHRWTVDAFKPSARAALAVTTQVCEMSLDLDADVLISELAPVTALVQRFGRANRHLAHGLEFRARLVTYAPRGAAPYAREELMAATAMLRELGTGDVSQRQLAEALERHAPGEPEADGGARFLDAGYFATPGAFRDGEDFTRPCLLDEDLPRARALRQARESLDGLVVSVPRRSVLPEAERPAWLPPYLGVARAALYDRWSGFHSEETPS